MALLSKTNAENGGSMSIEHIKADSTRVCGVFINYLGRFGQIGPY